MLRRLFKGGNYVYEEMGVYPSSKIAKARPHSAAWPEYPYVQSSGPWSMLQRLVFGLRRIIHNIEKIILWNFKRIILLIRDMVVESCNRQFGRETIHPTKNLLL